MNKIIFVLCAVVFAMTSFQLFSQDAPAKMIITLGEFQNKSTSDKKLFDTLIDRLTNEIINTRKFDVVDQARLKEAIDQHKLVDGGLSDAADAPKKGKIKSAGFKIYGTVLNLGFKKTTVKDDSFTGVKVSSEVELNVRFMDVETGLAIASKTVKAAQSKAESAGSGTNIETTKVADNVHNDFEIQVIQAAIADASKKVVNELMELAYPTVVIKVGASDITINLPKERAEKGQIWAIFKPGEAMKDATTGENLGADEEQVGEIEITQINPKFAKAKPVGNLKIESLAEGMIVRPLSEEDAIERKEKANESKKTDFKKRF